MARARPEESAELAPRRGGLGPRRPEVYDPCVKATGRTGLIWADTGSRVGPTSAEIENPSEHSRWVKTRNKVRATQIWKCKV